MAQSAITVTKLETAPPPTNFTARCFWWQTPPNAPALASGSDAGAGGHRDDVRRQPRLGGDNTNLDRASRTKAAGTEVVATTYTTGTGQSRRQCRHQLGAAAADGVGARQLHHFAERAARLQPVAGDQPGVGVADRRLRRCLARAPQLLTCTGTDFVPGCRIWVNNVEQTTTFVNATTPLTATIAKKAIGPGTWPVDVKLAGVAVPLPPRTTFTWT